MENREKLRYVFLKSVESKLRMPNMNQIAYILEKAVKKQDKSLVDYSSIVSIGTSKFTERIDKLQLKNLLIDVYKYWYNITLSNKIEENKNKPEIVKTIKKFKKNPYYKPSKSMPIFKIWSEIEQFGYRSYLPAPIYFQGNYFVQFHINKMQKVLRNRAQLVDARIYLKIRPKCLVKLSHILVKESLKRNLPLIFKIAYNNKRNDNFVLYSDYENLPSFIKLIEETKKLNPRLFQDCEITNPFMATLYGYMGFGEEPMTWGSYNSVRTELLADCYKELSKLYKANPDSLTKCSILKSIKNHSVKHGIDENNFHLNVSQEKYYEFLESKSKEKAL